MEKWKNFITVEVPKDSNEWDIDDFLGNCLQYKVDGKWKYDTKTQLPVNDLKVIGPLSKGLVREFRLDTDKKWLLIKCLR